MVEQAIGKDDVEPTKLLDRILFQVEDTRLQSRVQLPEPLDVLLPGVNAQHVAALPSEELRQMTDATSYVENPLAAERKIGKDRR